jgi:hypothetical protein
MSDALIDSTIMKEYLHPDVSVEWNSKGFVQLDYDGSRYIRRAR